MTSLKQLLPDPLKQQLKRVYSDVQDTVDVWRGKRDPMVPLRSQVFIGLGDYIQIAHDFRRYFSEQGGLKPHESVLDVGCGSGRMAYGLTSYMSPSGGGKYDGFDIVKSGIDWCQQKITPRFPNFRFQHADVFNEHYNPQGRYQATEYRFPYADNHFDFVLLTSVFTHMPPAEVAHYVAEIARVLKPGGRMFATFFLLNDESRQLMTRPNAFYNFSYKLEGRYTFNPNDPDAGTAFDESWVMNLLNQHGLNAPRTVYPGSWSSRTDTVSFQDIVVAYKQ